MIKICLSITVSACLRTYIFLFILIGSHPPYDMSCLFGVYWYWNIQIVELCETTLNIPYYNAALWSLPLSTSTC